MTWCWPTSLSLTGSIIRAEAVDDGEASASKGSQSEVGVFDLLEDARGEEAEDDQYAGDPDV
jgi:hypothetical protein